MLAQHILLVSYVFPPFGGIGGRRWAKFAKSLAQRGHNIHVIHCALNKTGAGSPWSEDVIHPNIHAHLLPKKYPTILGKRPISSIYDKLMYRYWMHRLPKKVPGNYLDKTVFWQEQLVEKATALITEHGIKNVIVTGAPFRLLFFALQLKKLGVHLVGDLRDPWTSGHAYGYQNLSKPRMRFEIMMEEQVVKSYDIITSPAQEILDELALRYPDASPQKFHQLRHAFDPEDAGGKEWSPPNNNPPRLMYAGSLYDKEETTEFIEAVFSAAREIKSRHSTTEVNIPFIYNMYLPANDNKRLTNMAKSAALENVVRFKEPISSKQVFLEMAQHDMILAFLPSTRKEFLSTKYAEIFSFGIPILHVGPEGYVSKTIEKLGLGWSVRTPQLASSLKTRTRSKI